MYGQSLTARELVSELSWAITSGYTRPLMIWGAPGLGKTRITEQVAHAHGIDHRVFRICDKSPVEINGVPVPKGSVTQWLPPDGLPTTGRGILLIDEIVRAPFTMQGVAQQLIHERRTMSYHLPDGWFVFATGNRKQDRTGSFDMPADVANRFDHYTLVPDLESTLEHFVRSGVHEDIIGFLRFRPEYLHHPDPDAFAWPSPRTWLENAQPRLLSGRPISPAVGVGVAAEFQSYRELKDQLPDLAPILAGRGDSVSFPSEASLRYAVATALALRSHSAQEAATVLAWLSRKAPGEFLQVAAGIVVKTLRTKGLYLELAAAVAQDETVMTSLKHVVELAA
jgi:hypothetical protein